MHPNIARSTIYDFENVEPVGNISLEEGVLLTTGVPMKICLEIAEKLSAGVIEEDRS